MGKKINLVTVVAAALAAFAGGCASVNPVVQTTAAPISHKLGQGSHMAATARVHAPRPYTSPIADVAPRAARPVAKPRRASEPIMPDIDVPRVEFDAAGVDDALYAHMRVGKRYEIFGKHYTPRHQPDYDVTGTASWYGPKFHGKPTASGETFDMNGLSVAHKTLPLNSLVHVENTETGASMVLRVNDRGPFVGKRIIDLSKAAAAKLGLLESGLKEVRVRYVGPADPNTYKAAEPVMVAEIPDPTLEASESDQTIKAPQSFDLDAYKPLRELAAPADTPSASLPDEPEASMAVPAPFQPTFRPLTPVQPDVEDGPLTLTIKGPIHMATSRTLPGARSIIPASTRD